MHTLSELCRSLVPHGLVKQIHDDMQFCFLASSTLSAPSLVQHVLIFAQDQTCTGILRERSPNLFLTARIFHHGDILQCIASSVHGCRQLQQKTCFPECVDYGTFLFYEKQNILGRCFSALAQYVSLQHPAPSSLR